SPAAVTFSVSALPGRPPPSFPPRRSSDLSTMTVATGAATPPGSYALTITGVSGTLTHTTSVTLAVNPAPVPDFSLSATPASQALERTARTSNPVIITPAGVFTAAVTFSVSGLPVGPTARCSPLPPYTTLFRSVATGAATPPGSYALTITGVSGTLTRTTSVTLAVNPASVPDFSLSATPAS